MYRLAVDPDYRRAGIARRLGTAVEQRLKGLGASRLTALMLVEEAGAPEFWSEAGFSPDPLTER
ncbi:MAG TPA: GNAT family N-acetyltransferase [Dehalococcoidia bacterium]|jgi:GNAT superfamily N-acetyltransferase|nr:GNAT family N-acetyltransferase [Dehalococcoidia bacterium]